MTANFNFFNSFCCCLSCCREKQKFQTNKKIQITLQHFLLTSSSPSNRTICTVVTFIVEVDVISSFVTE